MTELQVGTFIAAIVLVLLVSVAAQFNWLGNGRWKTIVVFSSGVAVIVLLWIGGLPPSWFAGTAAGFSLAASLTATALIGSDNPAEKTFRRPLFLGLGLTLLLANLARAIKNVL